MTRSAWKLALPLAALLLPLTGSGHATAQVVVAPPPAYYYPPPTVAYYAPAPVCPPAPVVSYYYAPSVSYYTPAVSYYSAPAVVAPAAAVTTTRYGLLGLRQVTTTRYYPPAYAWPY